MFLSDEELNKLSERYSNNYKIKIEDLSAYLRNNPNKYKDHYATLTNWLRKEETNKDKKSFSFSEVAKEMEETDGK